LAPLPPPVPDPTATPSIHWAERPAVKSQKGVQAVLVPNVSSDSEPSARFELISPESVHRGEQLTIAFKWLGPAEANLYEVFLTIADSGSCVDGPLQYSRRLEGMQWNLNYYIGPWHASASAEDLQVTVDAPLVPAKFRICLAPLGIGEQVWEEFYFEWLP
jgi:hypothetical protein